MNVDPMAVRRGPKLDRRKLLVLGIENQGDCGGFSLLNSNRDWERKGFRAKGGLLGKNYKIKISLQKNPYFISVFVCFLIPTSCPTSNYYLILLVSFI